METRPSGPEAPETRRPYETPELTEHGHLQDLTRDDAQDFVSVRPA